MNEKLEAPNGKYLGLAIVSVVCSVMSFLVFGVILAPLGIIFGASAMPDKDKATHTCAIIGLSLGLIALCLVAVSWFNVIALWSIR